MLHAITLHLLWVLKFRVYSNAPALDLFSKQTADKKTKNKLKKTKDAKKKRYAVHHLTSESVDSIYLWKYISQC